METSVSPLTRENLLEHENNHVIHQSSSQFVSKNRFIKPEVRTGSGVWTEFKSYDDERNSPTLYAKPPTGLKVRASNALET